MIKLGHTARPYWIALPLLVAALFLSVMVGSVFLSPRELAVTILAAISGSATEELRIPSTILFSLRLPRTVLVAMTGAALAGSGAAYQGLFRNPLADPYLIGVASGAGLGAVAAMSLNWRYDALGLMAVPLSAFTVALLTVFIVYQLARSGRTLPVTNLVLAGVAVSSFAGALTSFLMLSSTGELRRALAWLLGGSALTGWQPVLALLPYWLVGLGVLLTMGHALNVMQFGDEQAQQLGLPVARARRLIIVAASLTTAAAVSFAGIIAFVGLIVPHLLRLLIGGDYRRLLPLSLLGGAAFLLFADVLARLVLAPQELPVGMITALTGAPFFLWILRRSRQQPYWS
ncbi:MAG: iron ABC transporter permease [Chloroflexota bacterium]